MRHKTVTADVSLNLNSYMMNKKTPRITELLDHLTTTILFEPTKTYHNH